MSTATKSAARLDPGDRIMFGRIEPGRVRRVFTVDRVQRLPRGVIRIHYGKYGLQHIDAAGTHRFDVAAPGKSFDVASIPERS